MNIELVGERLKKIRQEKGFSLEDIQKKTKVHINILKAIEGESLTNLSPVYLKSFIKIYCKALGVEPKDYIPDLKEAAPKVVIAPKAGLSKAEFIGRIGKGLSFFKANKELWRKLFLAIAVLFSFFLLLRIGGCIVSKFKRASNESALIQRRADVVQPAVPKDKIKQAQQYTPKSLPKDASGQIRLVISAKENCLVYVKSDGRVVFHRVLEKGRSDTWKAKDKIELSLANPWAVELTVNGQRFTNLGKRGQPLKNIVITEKEGLRITR